MSNNKALQRALKYLWDPEHLNLDHTHSITCLGVDYSPKPEAEDLSDESERQTSWPPAFLNDVESKVWLTYRTNFPLIPKSKNGPSTISIGGILRGSGIDFNGFTSDIGWGCMIRTAQSLLANTLIDLKLGRDWRRDKSDSSDESEIIKLFVDDPSAPFSLHRFVQHGELACGKLPGQWFGPSAAASSIKALCEAYSEVGLRIYISDGSDIYEDVFMRSTYLQTDQFQPTMILMGLRLGIDKVNPIYWDALRQCLSCYQSVGIAGGRPSASHYFYGYQEDQLFYLDPHIARPILKCNEEGTLSEDDLNSVHTTKIRALHLSEMDPSMLVGFLIRTLDDWNDWKDIISSPSHHKIINISAREPMIRRSSYSVGSDDDCDFIDVAMDQEASNAEPYEEEESVGNTSEPILVDSDLKESPQLSRMSSSHEEGYENVSVLSSDRDSTITSEDEPVNITTSETFSEGDWEEMNSSLRRP